MVANYKEVLYDNETLDTPNLVLRKFKKEDAADIFEFASDDETVLFLTWERYKTINKTKAVIVNYYWPKPGIFAIELKTNRKCIGCMDLRLMPEHEKASFGYVLNRQYWCKKCVGFP